jgi:hypothetical protein
MARHNDGVHAGSVGRPHAGAEVVRASQPSSAARPRP